MEGPPDNRGVNLRSLEELFALRDARADTYEYSFVLSYLEIYNEQVPGPTFPFMSSHLFRTARFATFWLIRRSGLTRSWM